MQASNKRTDKKIFIFWLLVVIALAVVLPIMAIRLALATDTGWYYATALTMPGCTGDGSQTWTSTANGKTCDGSYTYSYVTTSTSGTGCFRVSKWLNLQTYGFNLPDDATVTGIEVKVKCRATTNIDTNYIKHYQIRLGYNAACTMASANYATAEHIATSWTEYTFGGSGDTWGRSWTVSEIENSYFGVRMQINFCRTTQVANEYDLDCVGIKVYYTTPTPSPTSTPSPFRRLPVPLCPDSQVY